MPSAEPQAGTTSRSYPIGTRENPCSPGCPVCADISDTLEVADINTPTGAEDCPPWHNWPADATIGRRGRNRELPSYSQWGVRAQYLAPSPSLRYADVYGERDRLFGLTDWISDVPRPDKWPQFLDTWAMIGQAHDARVFCKKVSLVDGKLHIGEALYDRAEQETGGVR